MRELRVIGVTPDSTHIVCIDTETGNKYRLPADDKLRAAARGDLARFGQIEIEMEATMRPRDIQARIRAGASVEQVTEESGMPASRVERFAYPVLLERARAAELAQKAHPVRPDGPAVEILIDIVTAAFTERGHTLDNAEWDAWKDEKGYWVAQLQWQNGHSEIAAHWRYQPDAHGGSVSPLDDPAADLVDPDFGRALRGLATILPAAAEIEAPVAEPEPVVAESPSPRPAETRPATREAIVPPRPAARQSQPALDEYYEPQRAVAAGGTAAAVPAASTPPPAAPTVPAAPAAPAPAAASTPAVAAGTSTTPAVGGTAPEQPAAPPPSTPAAPPAAAATSNPAPAAEKKPAKPAPAKAARNKRGKAPMPSWEDVLLGVRSSGH
ncbi:septation protein SepH [Nocardia sp. XZ_19_385]|uniref:septation protein SepH n=1 Tax=Nocardia sp. XZ_19_385 TaxID=2769488 RepID=UPI00188F5C1F|nr:septation protein SepH [Nocardia sp. XZ_19_385]